MKEERGEKQKKKLNLEEKKEREENTRDRSEREENTREERERKYIGSYKTQERKHNESFIRR